MAKMITCKQCGEYKPHKAHGLCLKCYRKEYAKQYYQKNRERILQYGREHPERYRKYDKYSRNKELRKKWQRQYYRKNQEKIEARRKDYYRQRNKARYHNLNKSQNSKVTTRNLKNVSYWVYNLSKKYVHTAIAEKILGRRLKSGEVVHHIDGNGLNNTHKNLLICTQSYHKQLHVGTLKR